MSEELVSVMASPGQGRGTNLLAHYVHILMHMTKDLDAVIRACD